MGCIRRQPGARNKGYWSQSNKRSVGYPNSIPSYVEEVGIIAEEEGGNNDGKDVTEDATAMRLKEVVCTPALQVADPGTNDGPREWTRERSEIR